MIKISYASVSDISSWMELVRLVSWNFPGLETEEKIFDYQKTLEKNIHRQTAICAKDDGEIVGILLFSIVHNSLSCMAVHPEYRKKGIATRMTFEMLTKLDASRDITVSTFREGDVKGIAPRALYKKLGFVEGRLTEEFGGLCQEFVLRIR